MTQRSTSGKLLSVRRPTDQNLFLKGRPERKQTHMTLYVIRAVKTGLVKVGISDSFDARLSKLRRENADEIEVLQVFHGDVDAITELERSLHQELSGVNFSP